MEEKNLANLIGRRLREIRTAQGLRQQDMEGRGISYKYYQRIESGKVNLTLSSVEKLASAFGIKILDLFQRPALKKRRSRRNGSKRV
ncbi:MAG: helix-turn-helix domain-containing protein [Candidatus Binatia bacterium]